MTDEVKQEVQETVTQEFVSLQDIAVFVGLQKDYQVMEAKLEAIVAKLELVKVQLKAKYHLNDSDHIDEKTGLITRA